MMDSLRDVLRGLLGRRTGEADEVADPRAGEHDGNGSPSSERRTAVETRRECPTDRSRSEADLLIEEGVTPQVRFTELLDQNGGWVRQKTLVSETGLSKTAVSRTLTDMEDDGEISRQRIGRENIVYLPGCEPTTVEHTVADGSPNRNAT